MSLKFWIFFLLNLAFTCSGITTQAAETSSIRYFFSAEEGLVERKVEITGKTAFDSLASFPKLFSNEPCLIEISKLVDKTIKEVNAPLLSKFAKQKTLHPKEPLSVIFSTSVYGVTQFKGRLNPDSSHCNLTAHIMEGNFGNGGVILSYDRLKDHFLPYDMSVYDDNGSSKSKSDYLAKSILNKTFSELSDMMNSKDNRSYDALVQARADAAKLKKKQATQKPAGYKIDGTKQNIDANEAKYLEESRQH